MVFEIIDKRTVNEAALVQILLHGGIPSHLSLDVIKSWLRRKNVDQSVRPSQLLILLLNKLIFSELSLLIHFFNFQLYLAKRILFKYF